MNRSVYSLVLSDEVIDKIDRLAAQNGVSRSNTVNRILAEYVSYVTPEDRIRQILSAVTEEMEGIGPIRLLLRSSENMLAMESRLRYKYNPTVHYSVELNRSPEPFLGELRVSVRSRNPVLLAEMSAFFRVWTVLEEETFGTVIAGEAPGRYTRSLRVNPDAENTNTTVGQAISAYVRLFDKSLDLWFSLPEAPEKAAHGIGRYMEEYAAGSPAIL